MKKAISAIAVVLFALTANAQYDTDYGFMLGVATHKGDINKSNTYDPSAGSRANPTLGAYYRYKFSSLLSVRGQLSWARLSGNDKYADTPERIARNLSFRTDMVEVAGIVEIHVIDIKDFGRTGRYNIFFNAYGFLGAGITYFEPTALRDNGERVKLRPLETEGQSYSNITPVFPIGIGAHFTFNRKWRLGAEIGYRITLTDYLDDVHDRYMTNEELAKITDEVRLEMQNRHDQAYIDAHPESFVDGYTMGNGGIRGGPESNDTYLFATANVGFLIKGKSNFYRSKYQFTRGRGVKKRRARAKF